MSENTKIEWADHTWNPWRGCTKISPGCANCYAERQAKRNPAVLGQWGKGAPRVLAKNWKDPLKWNHKALMDELDHEDEVNLGKELGRFRRLKVFPSFCDWLDNEVEIELFAQFLVLIHKTQNIDWLLLTKRPDNFFDRLQKACRLYACDGSFNQTEQARCYHEMLVPWMNGIPPVNVWVGTSIEDQLRCDERIPALLDIPAKLRFLSVEPLLGPVNLRFRERSFGFPKHITKEGNAVDMPQGIQWVIVGGESGPKSRPCNVDWIRSIVRQCATAGVPCFVKQLGSNAITPTGIQDHCVTYGTCHPKGGDPLEWPPDMKVRQFPEVKP